MALCYCFISPVLNSSIISFLTDTLTDILWESNTLFYAMAFRILVYILYTILMILYFDWCFQDQLKISNIYLNSSYWEKLTFSILPRSKKVLWLFYYFNFERNYDVSKSKSPCFLLNKKIKTENEKELKMENPTHCFKETKIMLQLL